MFETLVRARRWWTCFRQLFKPVNMWIGPHANDLLIVVYDLDIVNHRPDFFLLFNVGLQLVCVESLCEHLSKVSAVHNR